MKPSEFIESSCFLVVNYIVKDKFSDIKDKNNDKVEINISYKLIEELDKRFIDREELKDKIIILFKKRLDDKVINDENFLGFNDFKCDILELLESEDK